MNRTLLWIASIALAAATWFAAPAPAFACTDTSGQTTAKHAAEFPANQVTSGYIYADDDPTVATTPPNLYGPKGIAGIASDYGYAEAQLNRPYVSTSSPQGSSVTGDIQFQSTDGALHGRITINGTASGACVDSIGL